MGNGTVTSSPYGVSCGLTCNSYFSIGTVVLLTATPNSGYTFTGWTGACSGTGACVVTMNSNQSVSATFSQSLPSTYLISVINSGNGTVSSNSGKIDCGFVCSASYSSGATEVLFANPSPGYTFTGWSGGCVGTGSCILTVSSNQSVTANFVSSGYMLRLTKSGNGTISSSPSGINCGSVCSGSFNSGTVVSLTATPDSGYYFSGWSGTGPCLGVGTGNCSVTMTSDLNMEAIFAVVPVLSVSKVGNGTIISSPGGINCGPTCTFTFLQGADLVSLTATPDNGWSFSGWSGACTGTGTCSVSMDAAKAVTATFALPTYALTINKAGTGTGTITSSPTGISCGTTCSYSFNSGTSVALTATPDAGKTFTGWSGACSGIGACSLVMTSDKAVSTIFSSTGKTYNKILPALNLLLQ